MKIKKKCRAGAKWRARWDQNHLIFFTWPKGHLENIYLKASLGYPDQELLSKIGQIGEKGNFLVGVQNFRFFEIIFSL